MPAEFTAESKHTLCDVSVEGGVMNVRMLSPYSPRPCVSERSRHVSRRGFVRTASGAIATAAALGSGLLRPRLLHAAAPDDPLPIPGGTPALGGGFHLYGPTPDRSFDPIDAEPISITN